VLSIPKEKWGVHRTHCCFQHGCKYGNKDCPVELGLLKQDYPCEMCSLEKEFTIEFAKNTKLIDFLDDCISDLESDDIYRLPKLLEKIKSFKNKIINKEQ